MATRNDTPDDSASHAVERALDSESRRRRPLTWIVFVVLLAAAVSFVVANSHDVRVDWYGTSAWTSLWAVLAIAALAGAMLAELGRLTLRSAWHRRGERKANARRARDSVRRLERRRDR